jgi:hypothetical protein
MTSTPVTKCAHPPCRCNVEIDEPFCSEVCASLKDRPRDPCPCGHPECVGAEQAIEDEEFDVTPAEA